MKKVKKQAACPANFALDLSEQNSNGDIDRTVVIVTPQDVVIIHST